MPDCLSCLDVRSTSRTSTWRSHGTRPYDGDIFSPSLLFQHVGQFGTVHFSREYRRPIDCNWRVLVEVSNFPARQRQGVRSRLLYVTCCWMLHVAIAIARPRPPRAVDSSTIRSADESFLSPPACPLDPTEIAFAATLAIVRVERHWFQSKNNVVSVMGL